VDTQGIPHALSVTTADVTDRKGALLMFQKDKDNLLKAEKVLADGGYQGTQFREEVSELIEADVEIATRNALHNFEVIPKRWTVERSFAWLDKCRRLWKNCERKLNTSLQFMVLAFIRILIQRL